MKGNVQLEKMVEKAEEWVGKIEWMARVDGELEAEQGCLLWDLVARPGLEHAAEVWWPGGKTVGNFTSHSSPSSQNLCPYSIFFSSLLSSNFLHPISPRIASSATVLLAPNNLLPNLSCTASNLC